MKGRDRRGVWRRGGHVGGFVGRESNGKRGSGRERHKGEEERQAATR